MAYSDALLAFFVKVFLNGVVGDISVTIFIESTRLFITYAATVYIGSVFLRRFPSALISNSVLSFKEQKIPQGTVVNSTP